MSENRTTHENDVVAALDKMTPEEWESVVAYMAPEMAGENQALLAEIICREASRRAKPFAHHVTADHLYEVLEAVGLKLVPHE
jgi:hypothetical protein